MSKHGPANRFAYKFRRSTILIEKLDKYIKYIMIIMMNSLESVSRNVDIYIVYRYIGCRFSKPVIAAQLNVKAAAG